MLRTISLVTALAIYPFIAIADVQHDVVDYPGVGLINAISITGDISEEDAGTISSILGANNYSDGEIKGSYVFLNSRGGSVDAAIAIGRTLRKTNFDAFVLPEAICFSACVYLLAAGVDKNVQGSVGIHRPYLMSAEGISISETLLRAKKSSSDFFEEMNIPSELSEAMFSTDPAQMKILTVNELQYFRLNQKDFVAQEEDTHQRMGKYGLDRDAYEVTCPPAVPRS